MNDSQQNILNQMLKDKRFSFDWNYVGFKEKRCCFYFCNRLISHHCNLNDAHEGAVKWNLRRIGV